MGDESETARLGGFYQFCGWVAMATAVGMALAVVAFFIWPPVHLDDGGGPVLEMLADDPWGGFFELDPAVLILNLIQLPIVIGLFVALRPVNPAGAWTALSIGVPSVGAIVVARPIIELYRLADAHQMASTADERLAIEGAATALLAQFDGTGWAIATGGIPLSFLVSFVIMRHHPGFSRWTARLGIVTSVGSLPFFVPVVGPLLLLFAGTVAGVVTTVFLARDFFRLGRSPAPSGA